MRDLNKIEKDIIRILDTLEDCDDAYYVEGKPLIPDDAYDQLRRELISTPVYVDAIRCMQADDMYEDYVATVHRYQDMVKKIGTKSIKRPSMKRDIPMLSLKNVFSLEEIQKFATSVREKLNKKFWTIYTPKYDGLALELTYSYGELASITLRGDGEVGDDITHMYPLLNLTVPDTLTIFRDKERQIVRGEAVMFRDTLAQLNEQLKRDSKEPYTSARSAVAGRLNKNMPEYTSFPLIFFAYETLGDYEVKQYRDKLSLLSKQGFSTPIQELISDIECSSCHTAIEKFETMRPFLPFDIDGVVITVESEKYRNELGNGTRTPNYSVAYKFEPSSAMTLVKGIVNQVGRTGIVTPVAELKPVTLGSITCSRANLHDYANIARKDIRVGDMVVVKRAGDVIPDIESVVLSMRSSGARKTKAPTHCPACSSELFSINNLASLVCKNNLCASQVHNKLIHAANKHALNIKQLGPENIEDLIATCKFESVRDLLLISRENLIAIFGESSSRVDTIFNNAQEAVKMIKGSVAGQARLLYALSIPEVGKSTANALMAHFGSLYKIRFTTEAELMSVPSIGSEKAGLIVDWFNEHANFYLIDKLIEDGFCPVFEPSVDVQEDLGTVVFTGIFSSGTRDYMEQTAMDAGYAISKRVSKKTTLVVFGEKPGSALSESKRLGIDLSDETTWLELIESK